MDLEMSSGIDLHGLTVIAAIEKFVLFYNQRVKSNNLSSFEVVHGYGSSGEGGAIRTRLRSFLSRHSDYLGFISGEGIFPPNPGKTIVSPRKALPTMVDQLGEEILEFCVSAKTASKISGKFRRHGEDKIQSALKSLERQNLLESFFKGQYRHYISRRD